jgi:hypothetical protein
VPKLTDPLAAEKPIVVGANFKVVSLKIEFDAALMADLRRSQGVAAPYFRPLDGEGLS